MSVGCKAGPDDTGGGTKAGVSPPDVTGVLALQAVREAASNATAATSAAAPRGKERETRRNDCTCTPPLAARTSRGLYKNPLIDSPSRNRRSVSPAWLNSSPHLFRARSNHVRPRAHCTQIPTLASEPVHCSTDGR